MAEQWHYAKDDQRLGPVSGSELRAMAADGRLASDDLVWRGGMSTWTPAGRINGLFPSTAAPPPIPHSSRSRVHQSQDGETCSERVGFGPRFGAIVIDNIAVLVAGLVLGVIGALLLASDARSPAEAKSRLEVGAMIGANLAIVLYSLWEGITGAAAGKLAVGIVIANDDGTRAPTGVLMTRWLYKSGVVGVLGLSGSVPGAEFMAVLSVLLGLVVICGCFAVFGESRQALHDMLAHTAVYRKADLREQVPRPVRSEHESVFR